MHDTAEARRREGRYLSAAVSSLALAIGGYVVFFVLPVLYRRLTFPGLLEHQESRTILLLYRIAESLGNLYEMPALNTGSVIYNPAYYFYLWALHPLLGYEVAPIRIASVVPPLLLCTGAIEFIGRRYLRLTWLGVTWVFVSLAVYPLFTWIDIARLEAMMMLAIVLVWLTLCLDDEWRPKFMLVGLAIAFAFAIKQPGALLAAAPLTLVLTDRRYLISIAVAISASVLFAAVTAASYGEAYVYWAFTVPGSHEFSFVEAAQHLRDVLGFAPVILFAPLLLFARGIPAPDPLPGTLLSEEGRRGLMKTAEGKLLLVAAVTFLISAMGAGKFGGWVTQYVILLFLATIAVATLILRGRRDRDPVSMRYCLVVLIMLAYSVTMGEFTDRRHLITPRKWDRRQQAALLKLVESTPEATWVTPWPHVNVWAGRPATAPFESLDQYAPARQEITGAIRNRRFAYIVLPRDHEIPYDALIKENYALIKESYIHCASLPMRHFQAQLFLPTEVWARSEEECELARRALQQ